MCWLLGGWDPLGHQLQTRYQALPYLVASVVKWLSLPILASVAELPGAHEVFLTIYLVAGGPTTK